MPPTRIALVSATTRLAHVSLPRLPWESAVTHPGNREETRPTFTMAPPRPREPTPTLADRFVAELRAQIEENRK